MRKDPLRAFEAVAYQQAPLYERPESYDLDYAGYTAELPFYRMLIKQHVGAGDAYVELGAGTGRLAIPFAREGTRVHAVEPAHGMRRGLLAKLAKERPDVRKRVSVEAATAATFTLPRDARARLIAMPFNAILHIGSRAELTAAFARVRELIDDEGCFALDMTGPSWFAMSVGGLDWGRPDERVSPATGAVVLTCDRTRYLAERRVLESTFRFVEEGATEGVELTLEQRMWTWQEVLHALTQAGFAIERTFGDVDFAPFVEASPRLLVAALAR